MALRTLLVLALLFGFLVAISVMGSAIKAMGKDGANSLFDGAENPFAGLAVGILATVLVQSSSTTTSTIVSLVGAGALKLQSAVPMIMGANIGTTITNTLVSIGHVRQGQEFRRAFAAATVHDFFNLICVAIFLPLELATGFLRKTATWLTGILLEGGASGAEYKSPIKAQVKAAAKWTKAQLENVGFEDFTLNMVWLIFGIALTFVCLIFITRNMRVLISGPLERALNHSLGRSGILGILVGALITVSVQSSSITTSLLVPMCAAGVLTLRNAFPIMLGANLGTTVTAILASLAADKPEGLTIALVHLMFNMCGVLVIYPIPFARKIPLSLAEGLAARAQRNPLFLVVYVVGVFLLLPFLGWILFRTIA